MKSKTKILAALTLIALSVGLGSVYGQTETSTMDPVVIGIAFASFVASGVFYSASGWIKNIRKRLAGESVPLDYDKMAKSVGLGVLLGIGAFAYSAYQGDSIAITSMHDFLVQVGLNTAAILLVDKWILGRGEKQTATSDDGLTSRTVPTESLT